MKSSSQEDNQHFKEGEHNHEIDLHVWISLKRIKVSL